MLKRIVTMVALLSVAAGGVQVTGVAASGAEPQVSTTVPVVARAGSGAGVAIADDGTYLGWFGTSAVSVSRVRAGATEIITVVSR